MVATLTKFVARATAPDLDGVPAAAFRALCRRDWRAWWGPFVIPELPAEIGKDQLPWFQAYNGYRYLTGRYLASRRLIICQAMDCLRLAAAADHLRARLLEHNTPLVYMLAQRYWMRFLLVSRPDLHALGLIVLCRAIDGYNWTRPTRFSTYASTSILRAWSRESQAADRNREQACQLAIDPTDCREHADAAALDIRGALETADLTDRELLVVRLRFGLDGDACTLDTVGKRLHLTRERVRQIQDGALEKLRGVLA